MSVPRWLRVSHEQVFPHRAFLVSDVTEVIDFERSTRDNKVQAADRESGLPLWQVEVLDGDPTAPKRNRTVTVKFAAQNRPDCPPSASGMPFTPVIFKDLCVLPYVDRSGENGRIAWSFRASAMAGHPVKTPSTSANQPSS